jgi:hypothetical protein
MTERKDEDIAIDFIDPLFAVVLDISFTQIHDQPWFRDWHLVLREPYPFLIVTLFLGYLTVVLSWVGYHQSVKKCQINVYKKAGRCRFYLDIMLLFSTSFCW